MMKIRKANKRHQCAVCLGAIEKGEMYRDTKGRIRRLNSDDDQIGIEYYAWREHRRNCWGNQYEKHEHSIAHSHIDGNGDRYCPVCGIEVIL